MLKRAVIIGALIFVGLVGLNAVARANTMNLEQVQSFLKKLDSRVSLCEKEKNITAGKGCDFMNDTALLMEIVDVMGPSNREVIGACESCKKMLVSIKIRMIELDKKLTADIEKSKAEIAKNRKSYVTQIQGMELYLSNFTIATGDKKVSRGFLITCELRSGTNSYVGMIQKHIYENIAANETFTVGEFKPIHIGYHLDMDQVKDVKCGWYH